MCLTPQFIWLIEERYAVTSPSDGLPAGCEKWVRNPIDLEGGINEKLGAFF